MVTLRQFPKVNVSNTYKTQKSKISSILLFNKVTLINKTIFECIGSVQKTVSFP